MIISKQKTFKEVIEVLSGYQRIFIVGCNLCANVCHTGGEEEVIRMQKDLNAHGKEITGYCIVDAACHLLETKKSLKASKKEILHTDAVLSLACGAGTQSLAAILDKPVITAVNTMFLGVIERWGHFVETCIKCGDCMLNLTGGICPVSRCPKGILNGPCGGMSRGKCEVDAEKECVWVLIYERLKKQGRLEVLKRSIPAFDNSIKKRPGILILRKDNGKEQT